MFKLMKTMNNMVEVRDVSERMASGMEEGEIGDDFVDNEGSGKMPCSYEFAAFEWVLRFLTDVHSSIS